MIKLTVLYPNHADGQFDMEYYQSRHVPLVIEPDAPFRVTAHMLFDSVEALESSFGRHLGEFVADLPNFTNIQPMVQISEVLM